MKQCKFESLGLEIYSGQIMSRLTLKDDDSLNNDIIKYRVLTPKCINSDGSINNLDMPIESLRAEPEERRITKTGDIVMKLSTPYDAALISDESSGCLVPSFCAIIRGSKKLDTNYLLAFLNSDMCKRQLKLQVSGSVMSILSINKIMAVEIPVPEMKKQIQIGKEFLKVQEKLAIIREIAELSAKRNDYVFKELVKK